MTSIVIIDIYRRDIKTGQVELVASTIQDLIREAVNRVSALNLIQNKAIYFIKYNEIPCLERNGEWVKFEEDQLAECDRIGEQYGTE